MLKFKVFFTLVVLLLLAIPVFSRGEVITLPSARLTLCEFTGSVALKLHPTDETPFMYLEVGDSLYIRDAGAYVNGRTWQAIKYLHIEGWIPTSKPNGTLFKLCMGLPDERFTD